ncbi:MAG: MerC domain-containing protein [Pseudomonadota bacterium]
MIPSRTHLRQRLDRVGLVLAGLCALHCLVTIIVVSVLGIGGHFFLAHEIHEIGLVAAFIFALIAIGWGIFAHRQTGPALYAVTGLAMMGAGLLVPHGNVELVLTIIGVALVAYGHVLNLRSTKA